MFQPEHRPFRLGLIVAAAVLSIVPAAYTQPDPPTNEAGITLDATADPPTLDAGTVVGDELPGIVMPDSLPDSEDRMELLWEIADGELAVSTEREGLHLLAMVRDAEPPAYGVFPLAPGRETRLTTGQVTQVYALHRLLPTSSPELPCDLAPALCTPPVEGVLPSGGGGRRPDIDPPSLPGTPTAPHGFVCPMDPCDRSRTFDCRCFKVSSYSGFESNTNCFFPPLYCQ